MKNGTGPCRFLKVVHCVTKVRPVVGKMQISPKKVDLVEDQRFTTRNIYSMSHPSTTY